MAKQPLGGRPNKAALSRMKLGTAVVSIAAFVGSLGAVAYLNPGIQANTSTTAQVRSSTSVASTNSITSQSSNGSLQLATRSRQASAAPLVRTRGS